MFAVERIESMDLPELAPYRTMRRPAEHRDQGIFVAEGSKVVQRLLESSFHVLTAVMPEEWLDRLTPLLQSRPEQIRVFVADKSTLETLTGFSMYQGVLAVGKIPAPARLEDVLAKARHPFLFAAVDGLTNAENLGVVVRNCAAFGAQGFLVGETSSSPFLRRAVRNSMGTVFKLPVVECASLAASLRQLRQRGVQCFAAHPHSEGKTLSQAELRGDCCIVFGSEGYGLSPEVLEACSEAVAVPMHGDVDSLNVGSASAVFLYEVSRQRGNA